MTENVTKEEFGKELFNFWERIGYVQERIDFTPGEKYLLEELAFYVKKTAINIDINLKSEFNP